MTEEQALEFCQAMYREQGYLIFACNYPKDIGELLGLEDEFLKQFPWRVTGASSIEELRAQIPPGMEPIERSFYYRAEIAD